MPTLLEIVGDDIAMLLDPMRDDPLQVVDFKQQNFAFLDLSGKIGGVQRQVRLQLSRQWWQRYVDTVRNRRIAEQG